MLDLCYGHPNLTSEEDCGFGAGQVHAWHFKGFAKPWREAFDTGECHRLAMRGYLRLEGLNGDASLEHSRRLASDDALLWRRPDAGHHGPALDACVSRLTGRRVLWARNTSEDAPPDRGNDAGAKPFALPRQCCTPKILVSNWYGRGPSDARIAATAVRNLAAESVLRPRLVHKSVGNSLARMLVEGPLAPHPTSDADLVLAAEALQRCALAITGAAEETDRMRKRLVADGAEGALTSAAELHENEDADTESVQRRRQAASYALDALHGKLDVQSLPGSKGKQAQSTLKGQLSTQGTDYSKWDDHKLLSIPRYNTFISHKRSSAQDFARGLHSLIVHHGHSCFIDVENLESLSDLPMVVAGCDVFILV
jgi:hypothetical protein